MTRKQSPDASRRTASRRVVAIGDLEVRAVYDGRTRIKEPPGVSALPEEELADHRRYLPGDGGLDVWFGAHLVRTGDRVILLDAGLGPHEAPSRVHVPDPGDRALAEAYRERFRALGRADAEIERRLRGLAAETVEYGHLADSLAFLGVAPADVTDVVVTHLHCDHMGWVSHRDRPFFPNARVWAHEEDVAHFLGEHADDERHFMLMYGVAPTRERMEPVLSRLEPWSSDRTIAPGVDLVHAPGHTPGNALVVLSSRGERGIVTGDTIHCPLELTVPGFGINADVDRVRADATKRDLLRLIETTEAWVGSTHFPGLEFGRLGPAAGSPRRWEWHDDAVVAG
ncbi:MBL fold metallo-hydrolase [Microbacterium sp. No. 7]|uniref:MBL fold metallo-hydrolase n=1 Tax=Microbacterium sp. No. 7 TaxID=1714373 RepID=UPI0006D1514C|nr:MBL fold metallo-hydrolase [Microbacterium sp. No. 7]